MISVKASNDPRPPQLSSVNLRPTVLLTCFVLISEFVFVVTSSFRGTARCSETCTEWPQNDGSELKSTSCMFISNSRTLSLRFFGFTHLFPQVALEHTRPRELVYSETQIATYSVNSSERQRSDAHVHKYVSDNFPIFSWFLKGPYFFFIPCI